jgi:predicted ATPase
LEEALSLWRGDAFAEFGGDWWAQGESARLEELRLHAREAHAEALLGLGRSEAAVSEARSVTAEHPSRERAWRTLVVGLHRCGRQGDALRAAGDYRAWLRDESGLDPSKDFAALEHDVAVDAPHLRNRTITVSPPDPAVSAPTLQAPAPRESGASSGGDGGDDVRAYAGQPARGGLVGVPGYLTSFVGREREVATLAETLTTARLVTLTGPPGVGKTRLAAELATRMSELGDGVWFVELASVRDPDRLDDVVASGLGIAAGPSRRDGILDAIGQRDVLLVLDNAEHMLDAVGGLVIGLAARCRSLRIVVTSREPVGIDGEWVWPVRSLLAQEAAVLFVDRARAANPIIPFSDEIVEGICRRLEGIPLAVELAAARVRSLALGEIHDRLEERFDLLTAGHRGGRLDRHRTMRAAIDWSYQLLDPDERTLFDRLSVFAGGFTLTAAESVCGFAPIDVPKIIQVIHQLTAKSVIVAEISESTSRYRLLESLREFAAEHLGAETAIVADRHATYYTTFAEAHGGFMFDQDEREVDRVIGELDNFRLAVSSACANAKADLALRLTTSLFHLWLTFSLAEVGDWVGAAADLDESRDHPLGPTAHGQAALAAAFRIDVPSWRHHLSLAEETWWEPMARCWLSTSRDEHLTNSRRAVALAAGEHPRARALADAMYAFIAVDMGEPHQEVLERMRAFALEAPKCGEISLALIESSIALKRGDTAGALAALDAVIAVAERSSRRPFGFHWHLASVPRLLWRFDEDPAAGLVEARAYLLEARKNGSRTWVQCALARIAVMLARIGRLEPAAMLAWFTRDPPGAAVLVDGDPAEELINEAIGSEWLAAGKQRGIGLSFDDALQLGLDQLADAVEKIGLSKLQVQRME